MRVTIVSGSYPPVECGIGDYTFILKKNLSKLGLDAGIITTGSQIDKWNMSDLPKLFARIFQEKPDIVHIQYPSVCYKKSLMINFLPMLFKLFYSKGKIFVTLHEFEISGLFSKIRQILMIIFSDLNICSCESEKKAILKYLPWKRSKIEVIPIGPNLEAIDISVKKDVLKQGLGVNRDLFVVIFFGNIHYNKGFDLLLKGFKGAIDMGFNGNLLVVGNFNPEKERYHKEISHLIEELGIGDRIVWTGRVPYDKASRYFVISDCAVFPFRDGASFRRATFIAALCRGLPTVVTRPRGKISPVLKNNDNVVFVDKDNPREISGAILGLSKNKEFAKRLGENARLLYSYFNWKFIAEKHLFFYKKFYEG